jgi:tRNA threonylcarbamoyl adenosine modification protein (Sua5/YciO/YrdC/YwlC family)
VQTLYIHPQNPQQRLIEQAVAALQRGEIIAYPTDSSYALGCHIGDTDALKRLRQLRGIDDKHHLTLVCADLSAVAKYAKVDNVQYRFLKRGTPGAYTFILQATKEVPKRLQHPKRATIGLRVPDNVIVHALLSALGEPILSCTFIHEEQAVFDPYLIQSESWNGLDVLLDGGECNPSPTTVIDMTGDEPVLIRQGLGELAHLGL